jgi:hypothetical protein
LVELLSSDDELRNFFEGGIYRTADPLVVPQRPMPVATVYASTESREPNLGNRSEVNLDVVIGIFYEDPRTIIEDETEKTIASVTDRIQAVMWTNPNLQFEIDGVQTCFAEKFFGASSVPYGQFAAGENHPSGLYQTVLATYLYNLEATTGRIT